MGGLLLPTRAATFYRFPDRLRLRSAYEVVNWYVMTRTQFVIRSQISPNTRTLSQYGPACTINDRPVSEPPVKISTAEADTELLNSLTDSNPCDCVIGEASFSYAVSLCTASCIAAQSGRMPAYEVKRQKPLNLFRPGQAPGMPCRFWKSWCKLTQRRRNAGCTGGVTGGLCRPR